ncbi:hypothetical protein ACH4T9_12765 [Micromonospora sp. NPDC020750]|uniref:hypothetical protein n=1 Tax=unclassified Micromonospora TaxID=2617518 RepID=UPI0037BB66F6
MTGKLTKADQYTVIGDGLAVGCLDLAVTGLTSRKLELELAFNHAWRNFPLATRFPQVKADLTRCDILTILNDSPRRRWSRVSWIQNRAWWEPQLPDSHDDAGEVAESIASLYGISREQWTGLARPLVDRLGDDHVRRG